MEFINLATMSLGMINAIETFTSVFNLYLYRSDNNSNNNSYDNDYQVYSSTYMA